MPLSSSMKQAIAWSSMIHSIFETGLEMKKRLGSEAVCDFSLGNPDLEPPAQFTRTLVELAGEERRGKHSYMPNAGYLSVRQAMAEWLGRIQGLELSARDITMSCGAGGGLNVVFKAILDPGHRVLVSAPCFMEYQFYVANHGGSLEIVPCKADFSLDLDAWEKALAAGPVAAVLVNSPNNPSGQIYSRGSLEALVRLLESASRRQGRRIYLVADEPYRSLTYGTPVPPILPLYRDSILVSSFSKELSIPGERIGWIALNPAATDGGLLGEAFSIATRILGFVNAPALMQQVVARCLGDSSDIGVYKAKRDFLCRELEAMGYRLHCPEGTFYLFPEAPGGDDLAFARYLEEERILVVPGRGFGMPGYFRIAFCVDDRFLRQALPGFRRALEHFQASRP